MQESGEVREESKVEAFGKEVGCQPCFVAEGVACEAWFVEGYLHCTGLSLGVCHSGDGKGA